MDTEILEAIADSIVDTVKDAIAPLKQEIAELKARPALHDAGVWEAGKIYELDACITHDGSYWVCKRTHLATGDRMDHTAFRLIVKHGKDAVRR